MNEGEALSSLPYGIPPSGFRLTAAARPGRVRLQVADLERSLDYYRKVLGFELKERPARAGRAMLGARGDEPPLIELVSREGVQPVPRGRRLGLYHYAILLPAREELGRFARHLAEAGVRAGASDHFVSEALYLQDPDGLGIEVYVDRPRSSWRHDEARQIVMATEPLDTEDLILSGGEEPWIGMPSGTVIGHVHLHVGDLERAAAFYHEGLGLDRTVWNYPGALFLSAGGYHHHVGVNTWAAGARPPGEDEAQLLEWEMIVPTDEDARGALENLEATGCPVEWGSDGGVARDPWGTALRLRRVGET